MNPIDSNSIQIINPFDSIASKKQQIQLQSFSNNSNIVNNRYSQVSNSISISNSFRNKENNNHISNKNKYYNNSYYSLSSNITNKDINNNTNNTHLNSSNKQEKSVIDNSNDLNFEIINNEDAINYKNNNNYFSSSSSNFSINYNNNGENNKKNENFNAIKEIDEEEYNETNQDFSRAIHLEDLESYVSKYKSLLNIKRYNSFNNYEINKRISDIINNSPFDNISICINKNGEVDMNKLLTVSNIVNIKSLNNKQITQQFNNDFYEQILSAKKFSNINIDLHNDINFDSSLISVTQLYTYNGKNKKLFGKKTRDISSNNGNSFLKAFIFNYFENLLSNLYLDNIIFIIYIISTKLSSLNMNDININEVLTILKIIFSHLENKNISEAYIVFINAFKENSFFEKGLIYFVKYCLKQFITDNYILFNTDYLVEIIQEKYANNLNDKFDFQNYIQEKIMPPQNEIQYEILIYYLLPLIFPINLVIYTNNKIKTNKLIFKNNSNSNTIFNIELNVKFGNTSIIYTDLYYNKYKNIIPYTNEFNYPADILQRIPNNSVNTSKNILCKECNSYPENYIQVGPKIKPICEKCFTNAINKVILKRYNFLKEDLFFHEEYYCSKINLTNALENNLYLSLNDFKLLLPNHNELSEEIHNIIINNKKCDICNKTFKSSKYSLCLYPCGHLICDTCFKKCINDLTHNRVILNKFDIKTEKFEYICPNPSCENNRIRSLDYFIYKYFDNVDNYIQKSEERFISQAGNFCCKCKKPSNKYNFVIESKIIKNKDLKHTICNECKKNLDIQKSNNSKRSHQTKFTCIFCEEVHIYNLINLEKNKNKEKNESCCNIF